MSQQHASVSQRLICTDNFMCCHTETEVADQPFYLTQSQYTNTGPTSPSTDPITPGAWQGSHWIPMFKSLVWLDPEKSCHKRDSNPGSSAAKADTLTTRQFTLTDPGLPTPINVPVVLDTRLTNTFFKAVQSMMLYAAWPGQGRCWEAVMTWGDAWCNS